MTDQTTVPPNAKVLRPDAVWDRLDADTAAFLAALPGPARIPVARLVWEAAVLGFANGQRHARLAPVEQAADAAHPARVVAGVMDLAARLPGDADFAALHMLAHAGQRAQAAARHAADEHSRLSQELDNAEQDGGNCDG
jgi:hypothetical protein